VKDQVREQAARIAEPILRNEGLELLDVEYLREGSRWILRLFIDKPGAPAGKGVGLEDCQRASHAVETALEVAELVTHEYALEVSSPGINRPLTRPEHFLKYVGAKVKVKTYGPVGAPPRKSFTGTLVGYADDAAEVEVEVEGAGRFRIPMKEIAKANLEVDL
jgi:ribosome maturation factor RimP